MGALKFKCNLLAELDAANTILTNIVLVASRPPHHKFQIPPTLPPTLRIRSGAVVDKHASGGRVLGAITVRNK